MVDVRKNSWPKRIGLTLLAVLGLLLILLLGALLWLRSESGRSFVETTLENMEFAGQSVSLDGLSGSMLGAFQIDRLELSGRDGVWLVAQDVRVDWSPRDIVSKRLTLQTLTVGDLDLLARPVLVPGETGGDPAITQVNVQAFTLPDIFIAEPVLGRDIKLSADGTLRHGPDGGATQLTAQSDQGDRISADLDWSRLLVVSGTADIEGQPEGLIARLLRLNDGQGVSATVRTQNDETQLIAQLDGESLADLRITRSQSQIRVVGAVEPTRLSVLDRLTPYLGGSTQIDAIIPRDEGAAASLELTAPKLSLNATGRQSSEAMIIDKLSLQVTDPLSGDVQIGTLTASGQAILGQEYRFEGQVDSRDMVYRDYRIDRLSGPASLSMTEGSIGFDANLTGVASQSVAQRADGAILDMAGDYALDARALNLTRANIRLPGLSFKGRGDVRLDDPISANVSGAYDIDSRVFRDGPSARLRGEATLQRSGPTPSMTLSGRATRISGLPDALVPLSGNAVNYTARLRFADGIIRLPQYRLGNAQFSADGTARWSDGVLRSTLNYRADAYTFAALEMQDITGQAMISGPADAIDFDADVTAQTIKTGSLIMRAVAADLKGQYIAGRITSESSVNGQTEYGPVNARGDVAFENGAWRLAALDGQVGDLISTGSISGRGGDMAALRADLTVSGSTPFIPAEMIEGRLQLSDLRIDIDSALTGIDLGNVEIDAAQIRATGARDAVDFTINATGQTRVNEMDRSLGLDARGLADLTAASVKAVSDFDLDVGSQTITGKTSVDHMADGWGGTLLAEGLGGEVQAVLHPGPDGTFTYELNTLSIPALARLMARPATEGRLSGSGQFAFVDSAIEGQTELILADLRSPISQAEPISVRLRAELAAEQMTATLEATEGGLSGQAQIAGPVQTMTRAPYLQWPPATPLQGQANLRGQVGPLVEVFLPPRTDIAGRIDSDVRFSVPLDRSGLLGEISLTDGVFEQGDIGLGLENIMFAAELRGETIRVPTLSAKGTRGGTLSGSGQMGIGEGTGTVDIQATKLRVIDRREGMAEVSGALGLSRTAELLRLAGELRVTDADIDIARLPKPGLPTLNVRFDAPDIEVEKPRSFASSRTELDIDVISSGRINVKGRGLDALMGLDASITGAFDDPTVSGEMTIARGRFDFLGKRFELRDSSILLRDDVLQSVLALEAIRQTSDLTAIVQVSGTIERPEIELTAEPTLPEDEVLSRVLFGRSPTQLTAIETARLAAALTQLSGGSGFDLFGTLEDAVGLDTLEIGQNETGETQLATGKYLSDNVYLEVRTAADGAPGIAVEWQIRDNISLEAETQPNERQRLSVQWKKDFD